MHPYTENGLTQIISHKGPVNKVTPTSDFNYLFSAGNDGTLFIYKLDSERLAPEDPSKMVTQMHFAMDEAELPPPHMKPSLA
jgi:WD40 repeat protein